MLEYQKWDYDNCENQAFNYNLPCCRIILNNTDKQKFADWYRDLNRNFSASKEALYLLK